MEISALGLWEKVAIMERKLTGKERVALLNAQIIVDAIVKLVKIKDLMKSEEDKDIFRSLIRDITTLTFIHPSNIEEMEKKFSDVMNPEAEKWYRYGGKYSKLHKSG